MAIKRVSVDKQTKEFSEERQDYKEPSPRSEAMGIVRKYVKDLKEHQKQLKNAYLNKHKNRPGEIQIKGFKTGSDFYPHSGMQTTGTNLTPFN